VTSLSSPRDIIRGLESGANMFIRKPYEDRYLLSRIDYAIANLELRKRSNLQLGVEIRLGAERHFITSERQQILDLLISTYEEAVRMSEELQEKQLELMRSYEILNGLYLVAEALNHAVLERQVFEAVLERATQLPGVQAGWVVLIDDDSRFRVVASRNLPDGLQSPSAFEGDCHCQRLLLSGQLDTVCNIQKCERLQKATGDVQGLRCHASIPLWEDGQPVGIMNLVGSAQKLFSEDELKILYGIGQQLSVALGRSRLLGQLERKVEERTASLTAEIAERKRAEQELRSSEKRYRDLVEQANDIVFVLDLEGNITSFNRAGELITGFLRGEACKKNLADFAADEHKATVRRALEQHISGIESVSFEIEIISKSEQRIALDVNCRLRLQDGQPAQVQGIARDVTQSRRLKEQLQQAQKLEAIGRLAGGIAHDFNNLLGIVQGYAELLRGGVSEPKTKKQLEGIILAAERGVSLTRQLLAFSRKQMLEPKVLNLNTVVSEITRILPRLIGEDIELRTKLSGDLGHVKVDPTQMEQVILNLVVNARDAMPNGGRLAIETANADLDAKYVNEHSVVVPGRYVLLSVSDTGIGMDRETQKHIFDPFFTTKPREKGTGLGLATVYGIVKQSGGYIWVYSEAAKGTSFKIYLPRVEEAPEEAKPAPVVTTIPRGSETVLVVEDNDSFRELIGEFLRGFGYTVLDAGDSEAALKVSDRHNGTIHLLVTDVVLPKITGPVLAEQLKARRPALKVVFMSGYAEDAITDRGILPSGIFLLQKPFTREALAHKVHEALTQS
jgi:PAS domain S-box-containing protein